MNSGVCMTGCHINVNLEYLRIATRVSHFAFQIEGLHGLCNSDIGMPKYQMIPVYLKWFI